jgi:hypothetical protein
MMMDDSYEMPIDLSAPASVGVDFDLGLQIVYVRT